VDPCDQARVDCNKLGIETNAPQSTQEFQTYKAATRAPRPITRPAPPTHARAVSAAPAALTEEEAEEPEDEPEDEPDEEPDDEPDEVPDEEPDEEEADAPATAPDEDAEAAPEEAAAEPEPTAPVAPTVVRRVEFETTPADGVAVVEPVQPKQVVSAAGEQPLAEQTLDVPVALLALLMG